MTFRGTSRAGARRGLGALLLLCCLARPHSAAELHFEDARGAHNEKDCHALNQATVSIVNGVPHVADTYAPQGEALPGLAWNPGCLHGHARAVHVSRHVPSTVWQRAWPGGCTSPAGTPPPTLDS